MRESFWSRRTVVTALALICAVGPSALGAQTTTRLDLGGLLQVGGEAERYLRILQITGQLPLHSWSIQPFAAGEVATLTPSGSHPWRGQFAAPSDNPQPRWTVLRPDARVVLNSSFVTRDMEGPAWYGRGLTAQIQAGVVGRLGRLRFQIAPLGFIAQNAAFTLSPSGSPFGDPRYSKNIDLPQRFGDKSYGRVDLGATAVQLDLPGVYLAASNEAQRWGPGRSYAMILGPNPGGFPHVSVGTSRPFSVGIGTVHARYLAGSLAQTSFTPWTVGHEQRLATGVVISVTPRWFEGLEVGAVRWNEMWMPSKLDGKHLFRPFTSGFNRDFGTGSGNLNVDGDNGMGSVFFRWVLPKSGAEFFGEMYREDYAGDVRTIIEKPDDLASYMIGMQYATVREADRLRVLRVEVANGQLSHHERGQRGFAADEPPYLHAQVQQGHTSRGLLLGADDAFGGAGLKIALEEFHPGGRWSVAFHRSLQMEFNTFLPATTPVRNADVLYSLRFERVRFSGVRDYTITIIPSYELNRYTIKNNDQFNLYIAAGIRGWR